MLSDLGRRIERLMYFGVLLLAACVLQTYMVATVNYVRVDNPAAFSALAAKIVRDQDKLQHLFYSESSPKQINRADNAASVEETRKILGLPREIHNLNPAPNETYSSYLDRLISESAIQTGIRPTILSESVDKKHPPAEVIDALRSRQNDLEKRPIVVWGIVAPVMLPLQYGAAQYQIPNWVCAILLFVALVPLCIGWLGSMYFTRQRELLIIRGLRDYKAAFPHILNVLPVLPLSSGDVFESRFRHIKEKNRARKFNRVFLSLLRSALVLMFALPMLFALAYAFISLFVTTDNIGALQFGIALIFGITLITQVALLVAQEWLLLSGKDFSS